MKKALSILLTLALLLLASSFAFAEETAEPAEARELPAELFDLWDYGGESPAWVDSAVPVAEGVLLAPKAVAEIPAEQLAVTDGESTWAVKAVVQDGASLLAMVFYDPAEKPARWGAWQLLAWGDETPASSCIVRFGDRFGSRINRGVLSAEEFTRNGRRFLLLDLTDPAPVGSPVLTADGLLAGVVTAQWAEGVNRVLVLPAEGVAECVAGVAGLLAGLPAWSEAPEGLSVTLLSNTVVIDWTGMTLPEKKDGEDIWIVLVDTGNDFLTSYPAEANERVISMLLTPGRFYIVGPVVSAGRPAALPESYASVYVPQMGKLTEYGFRPVLTAIAEAPEGGLKKGEAPVPVMEVTEELLRSGRAYFYSHSTYEVTENIEGKSLLVTLTDPNGNNYRYESGWLYSPDYMAEDIWYMPLSDTNLTAILNADGYPAGLYRVAFYVDGRLADEFSFELKQEQ